MSEELKEISRKLDDMQKKSGRDTHINRAYIFWGFAIAMLSIYLSVTNPSGFSYIAVATVVFWILGFVSLFLATRVK